MQFKFDCSHCGASITTNAAFAGRKGTCQSCNAVLVVPTPGSPVAGAVQPAPLRLIASPASPTVAPDAAIPARETLGAPSAAARARAKPARSQRLALSAVLGGALCAALYAGVIFPLRSTGSEIASKFLGTWVPYAEVFLLCWAVVLLAGRAIGAARARRLSTTPLIGELSLGGISIKEAAKSAADCDTAARHDARGPRFGAVLSYFAGSGSRAETASYLSAQTDLDLAGVHSAYTAVKVIAWALPIVGFLGTVIGISAAVAGFSSDLSASADAAALSSKLTPVVQGLATAFDTTLLALIFSVVIMFPASALQRAEEDRILGIDRACRDELLPRLRDTSNETHAESQSAALADRICEDLSESFRDAMEPQRTLLKACSDALGGIAGTLPALRAPDSNALASSIASHLAGVVVPAVAACGAEMRGYTEKLGTMGTSFSDAVAGQWRAIIDAELSRHQETLRGVEAATAKLRAASERESDRAAEMTALATHISATIAEGFRIGGEDAAARLRSASAEALGAQAECVSELNAALSAASGQMQGSLVEFKNSLTDSTRTHGQLIDQQKKHVSSAVRSLAEVFKSTDFASNGEALSMNGNGRM